MPLDISSATLHAYPYQHLFYPTNGLSGDGMRGESDNPALMASESGYRKTKNNYYQTKLSFDLDIPLRGVSADGYVAYDVSNKHYKEFRKPWDVYHYDKSTDTYTPRVASRSPRRSINAKI